MAIAARWIRLHPPQLKAMHAACAGFAQAQLPDSAPAALWAQIGNKRDADRHAFAIVAPLKFVPGRSTRWRSWALAPLVATYRQCGLSAYYDADRICLSGQPISGVDAAAVGACAVIVADFAAWGEGFVETLRHRVQAQYGWQFDHSWPADAERSAIAEHLADEAADAG
ncbi:MAG: hypothetical protein ACRET8_03655 [Burkholderiales bacterium]